MDSIPSTSISCEGAQDVVQVNHLRRYYTKVLDIVMKEHHISDGEMDHAISFVIDSFCYDKGNRFSNVDLNRPDMRCAYVFRWAAHHAGLARCRILEGLHYCDELKPILTKENLNVVSLGCGPANDAIGFCCAMSRSKFSGTLEMLLVDNISGWEEYCKKSVSLLTDGDYGEASDLFNKRKVKFHFRQCTLPRNIEELRSLNQCDVVLICKLMSIMDYINDRVLLAEKLFSKLNNSALILLIDVPFEKAVWCGRFDILYISKEGQEYCSGNRSMREFGNKHDFVCSKSRIAVLRKKKISAKGA